jgi:predicted permease
MGLKRIPAETFVACALRLLVSPLIGGLLVLLLQPAPLTGKVLVLQSAMPTAVNVAVIATEFDAEPDLVSSIVLLTTGLSLVTVTAWVAYLQSL